MNTLFNPVAMAGMHPVRRKKIAVNYCFKSSCEINETLTALCWLKRSPPTFNRLFNHTQLELCVCAFIFLLNTVACTLHTTCRDGWTNEKPFWRMYVHWMCSSKKKQELLRIIYRSTCKNTFFYYCILCQFMQTVIGNFAIFVFLHPLSEDYALRVFFLHPILNEVYSEWKQDFTLTVSLSFYWSHHIYIFNYFYFSATHLLGVLTLMLTQCVCL